MKKAQRYSVVIVITCALALMIPPSVFAQSDDHIMEVMRLMNEQLDAIEAGVRVAVAEYYTAGDEVGHTVIFDDRTKQLDSHWAPGDPRRGGYLDISWMSDQVDGVAAGLTLDDTQTALDNAMTTWDSVNCSTIPLARLDDAGMDWGLVQWFVGMGGFYGWGADITHAGWLPGSFFELAFGPGSSSYIIGVTFTFISYDDRLMPTDIDNNGKLDVSFREIYYNNGWRWGIDTHYPIDVETIVLHEAGHGLSQGHFGKLFMTNANGKTHFATQAVMNAVYSGPQQDIKGTDKGGHCSIWGSWPNN